MNINLLSFSNNKKSSHICVKYGSEDLYTAGKSVKLGITHKIVTKGDPVFARPRRLAPDKLVTAKREFDEMIKLASVIEPSEWSSALYMVLRKNGD